MVGVPNSKVHDSIPLGITESSCETKIDPQHCTCIAKRWRWWTDTHGYGQAWTLQGVLFHPYACSTALALPSPTLREEEMSEEGREGKATSSRW